MPWISTSGEPAHAYPIIRLPREFRDLAGSKAEIYQTVHESCITSLVKVISHPQNKLRKDANYEEKSIKGDVEIKPLKHVLVFLELLEEIAGSGKLIDADHKLSTSAEKLSTLSESCTDNKCSSATAPAYANNNHFLNDQSGETLSDLALLYC